MTAAPARSFLTSGVALAAAGALTMPVLPAAPVAGMPPVAVHVEDVALAGIGQDIYYAITPWVQYAVGGGSYLINFIPLVGGLTAAQININYFQGIQPTVEATVNYLAAVVQDPLNVIPTTAAYAGTLFDIGYNLASAQLMFLGLPPLNPLPQGAASSRPGVPRAAAEALPAEAPPADTQLTRPLQSDSAPTSSDQGPAVAVDAARDPAGSRTFARESLRGGHSSTARPRAGTRSAAETRDAQRGVANRSLRPVR